MWRHLLVLVFLFASACGKNDGVRPVNNGGGYSPNGPVTQAPPPQGGYYPPGGGYGGGGGGYGGGGPQFQPQMPPPPGYGQQFYPWMPIYQYFQQNVYIQPIFVEIWTGWENYCQQNQVPVYDFTTFWYDYCPQSMPQDLYGYFGTDYYYWMDPYTTFSPYAQPDYFWQNYSGVGFDYSSCGSCYY